MAAQTVFSVEMFPVGVSLMEDGQSLSDMPRNTLPAPQLVMLANVAAVTAAEGGNGGEGSGADEKEMMELKTVGSSYSDSEDENIIRCAACWDLLTRQPQKHYFITSYLRQSSQE